MNHTLDTIFSRCSSSRMTDGEIPKDQLDIVLKAAMTGNDHGRLKPWRFNVFKDTGRDKLIDAFIEHEIKHSSAELSPETKQKLENMVYRSSAIICVIGSPVNCKIPRRDQLFSAAAASQLLTLAAFSLGIASKWRTGQYAESDVVKSRLHIEPNEEIIGFVYLGKTDKPGTTAKLFIDEKITIYE